MSATTCTRCGALYDAAGDAADEPGRLCARCWRLAAAYLAAEDSRALSHEDGAQLARAEAGGIPAARSTT